MPDPLVVDQMEVENNEAATNNATEANDPVMAEDNLEPEANVNVEATVPPPRPHTIAQAFDCGQLVTVKWPIVVPPTIPGPQYAYHVEQMPGV